MPKQLLVMYRLGEGHEVNQPLEVAIRTLLGEHGYEWKSHQTNCTRGVREIEFKGSSNGQPRTVMVDRSKIIRVGAK